MGPAGDDAGRHDPLRGRVRSLFTLVIHVVAEQTTIEGRGSAPGSMIGADGLIGAELVAELAASAKLMALV
ncbi:MAG TPA: DUF222 domain-containing protein, partial [Mycobacterium sp.]|uniref:DUF222 domain-containing protein n=1 Tax=Mycobacterium sp. TaxID=1785 RepID=UPI002F421E87